MPKFFDEKTQTYIDSTLQTLNIWFGSDTPSPSTGGSVVSPTPRPRLTDDSEEQRKGNKALTYIFVGMGVLAVGFVSYYYIKKKKAA